MEASESPTCDRCGQPFERVRRDQRFCSTDCKNAWWKAHYQENSHDCPLCHMRHHPQWNRLRRTRPAAIAP